MGGVRLAEGRTRSALYVQPIPPTGAKYQVSRDEDDGHHAVWSPDGSELIFNSGPGPSFAVARVATKPGVTFAESRPLLSPLRKSPPNFVRPYDMTRDGRMLGTVGPGQGEGRSQIQVVLGWFEELKAKSVAAP